MILKPNYGKQIVTQCLVKPVYGTAAARGYGCVTVMPRSKGKSGICEA